MRLSIITINRNNAAGLEKTLKSVASQTRKDFDYMMMVGFDKVLAKIAVHYFGPKIICVILQRLLYKIDNKQYSFDFATAMKFTAVKFD